MTKKLDTCPGSDSCNVNVMQRVVEEARRLINSGYAGPFNGPAVEHLVAAVREYEKRNER